ncbi:MAG: acyl-CoA/acyl-ACP dehydrogenase [Thermogemmatispora sp.]|uniref:acyl-CoA dehydrogenase family protein n=1 Tax=Thermogemmatispora sp. TaxID=1968838 RepID=UPI00261AD70E|nr:acyl-CoA dehydrogenase family protein [Thermogemmatispora sp.]MBX5455714.1 acyl-CoA/acyl-ACP dehydrogenase [Thermogemmatispora sp.]
MDFQTSEEHTLIRESVRQLASRYGLEYWREKDRQHAFPEELWKELARAGWLGTIIPERYGGAGMGLLEMAIVVEEMAASGAGATIAQLFMMTPVFGALTILRHGSEEQRERYLPALARGEFDFSMALTEPDAGSDTLATKTLARRHGDEYVISGQKVWISGVDRAGGMLLVARTTPLEEAPRRTFGLSLFLVDPHSPGVSHQPLEKVGTHCVTSSMVFIDELVVPKTALIGEEGEGWKYLVDTLNSERIVTTAGCVGAGDLAIRLAVDYANARVVFGQKIGRHQAIQFPLARLKAEIEMARLMNYKAAWLLDHHLPCAAEANMAKMVAAEAAFNACDQAMQTLGGYGFSTEYHIERLWRDVRLFRLAPISQEMILNYIAQHVLGLPRSY